MYIVVHCVHMQYLQLLPYVYRYLVQNLTGMVLWYWSPGDQRSAANVARDMLLPGRSEEMQNVSLLLLIKQ